MNNIFTISGSPPPKLVWIWKNKTVDEDFNEDKTSRITNTYRIRKLSRKHHNTLLTCQAYNSEISMRRTSVRLKLFRKYHPIVYLIH